MTTTAQSTLPRTISPALLRKTPASTAEPVIGQRMPDGSVYAGISPDTAKPMYTTPKDTGLCADWYKAMDHAAKLNTGHKDWRVPTKNELNQLFSHRAAIGNFDETDHIDRGWYWSSSQGHSNLAWMQRFSDGNRANYYEYGAASLRCVRG